MPHALEAAHLFVICNYTPSSGPSPCRFDEAYSRATAIWTRGSTEAQAIDLRRLHAFRLANPAGTSSYIPLQAHSYTRCAAMQAQSTQDGSINGMQRRGQH
mmetsp:Transcript_12744/g.34748  ORF Transcript_12744/g.34748 Transcript_12744/m.34748 type:complete len:101 (+) Transcript_12744:423-725(+)